jgi:hypothetical protein
MKWHWIIIRFHKCIPWLLRCHWITSWLWLDSWLVSWRNNWGHIWLRGWCIGWANLLCLRTHSNSNSFTKSLSRNFDVLTGGWMNAYIISSSSDSSLVKTSWLWLGCSHWLGWDWSRSRRWCGLRWWRLSCQPWLVSATYGMRYLSYRICWSGCQCTYSSWLCWWCVISPGFLQSI